MIYSLLSPPTIPPCGQELSWSLQSLLLQEQWLACRGDLWLVPNEWIGELLLVRLSTYKVSAMPMPRTSHSAEAGRAWLRSCLTLSPHVASGRPACDVLVLCRGYKGTCSRVAVRWTRQCREGVCVVPARGTSSWLSRTLYPWVASIEMVMHV